MRFRILLLTILCLVIPGLAFGVGIGAGPRPSRDLGENLGAPAKRYAGAYLYNSNMSSYAEWPEIAKPANPAANYGRLYVKDVTGTTSLMFLDSSGTETNLITALSGTGTDAANGVWFGTNSLIFEGATADAYETSIVPTDPTADRTFTLPNASGTAMISTLATNAPDVANSVYGTSNALTFEGATADAYETSVTVVDPTADRTVTLPDATGTVMLSTLATNAPDAANSVTGASNGLVFEGATANAYETTLTVVDPTADRTITLPDRSGTVVLETRAVTAKTQADTPVTLTATDIGGRFSNAGATGAVIFNLPEASTWIGGVIRFTVLAAQNLDVNPDNGDQILAITNAAGDALRNATIGGTLTLMAVDSTNIVVISSYGTWSDVN